MRIFTKIVLPVIALFFVLSIHAQDSASTPPNKPLKDPQNQTRFLEPDMQAQEYNYSDRKRISTPLMMRYDLDTAVYQNDRKKRKQQQAFKDHQYAFPAKPKDAWELGINFGSCVVSGDVKPYYKGVNFFRNASAGFTIRKAIGYSFSIRGGYNFMSMLGRNYEPDQNIKYNKALRGSYDPRVNYYNNTAIAAGNTQTGRNMNTIYFHNFLMTTHETHLEAVVNLGNIRFHRERSMVSFYAFVGASAFFYQTKTDALDANGNVYDFSTAYEIYSTTPTPGGPGGRNTLRPKVMAELDKIFDGKFESKAERQSNVFGIGDWQFIPTITFGAGLQFHVSKWVTIGLEQRFIMTQEDLLDGYRWTQDEYASFTPNSDNISYTSLSLNFHLGLKKRTEPMYWLNPMYHPYKKIGEMDPESIANELFKDDDEDGVPNRLDKEPNSEPDCPVDSKGVMLDSDKDSFIDCKDKEPYSPPGYPVDSFGVAILPPNPCCDTSGYYDDPNGAESYKNGYIDENGNIVGPDGTVYPPGTESIMGTDGGVIPVSTLPTRTPGNNSGKPRGRRGGSSDCSRIELPDVVFDFEKYYIDPQYYSNLHQIAERMQSCPDMRLVVTGLDESRNDQKFNEQLAWNRANAAVDYLSEKYGISRDRYIIKYKGGKKAATGTAYEKKMKSKVAFRYASDSESGDSNPPAPHPGLKAGSNK